MRFKRIFNRFWLAFLLLSLSIAVRAQHTTTRNRVVVIDKMVATVNGELITYSDLLWQLALQPDSPLDNPRAEDLTRSLNRMIDQHLISQEAEKPPHIHADDKEVEEALTELVRHFSSPEELRQRMNKVGLTSDKLREIIHERVDIEKYLDFRFRAFVVVTAKEIENYYKDVFVPRFRARSPGAIVPQLEQARAGIETHAYGKQN